MADSTKRPKAESQLDVKQVGFIRFFKDIVSTHRCHLNSQALSDMMPIVAWHLPLNRRVKFIFFKAHFLGLYPRDRRNKLNLRGILGKLEKKLENPSRLRSVALKRQLMLVSPRSFTRKYSPHQLYAAIIRPALTNKG